MKKLVLIGKIEEDEYGLLCCDGDCIAEAVFKEGDQNGFKVGDRVSVRYFITDRAATQEEVESAAIMITLGGPINKLNFVLDAFGEMTIEALEQDFVVGGHDLINELWSFIGCYSVIIIEEVK